VDVFAAEERRKLYKVAVSFDVGYVLLQPMQSLGFGHRGILRSCGLNFLVVVEIPCRHYRFPWHILTCRLNSG